MKSTLWMCYTCHKAVLGPVWYTDRKLPHHEGDVEAVTEGSPPECFGCGLSMEPVVIPSVFKKGCATTGSVWIMLKELENSQRDKREKCLWCLVKDADNRCEGSLAYCFSCKYWRCKRHHGDYLEEGFCQYCTYQRRLVAGIPDAHKTVYGSVL